MAYAIHANSPRKSKPFVVVNCAALSEGVLESELFGHVKGAFTGAYHDKPGRFESADGGTVFLDEIGEVSLATQVKLLRVLERGEFERVGGNKTVKVDVRIVTATNHDLAEAVKRGTFREDLYFRIRVFPLKLPPLRERREDLPLLVNHFVDTFNGELGKGIRRIAPEALEALEAYSYPGNIRELQNVIEHAFVCCEGHVIRLEHLPRDIFEHSENTSSDSHTRGPLRAVERDTIKSVLERTGWRYKTASTELGISRSTLWRKLRRLNIRPPQDVSPR